MGGTRQQKNEQWQQQSLIKIVNYEEIRITKIQQEWDLIILDEATRIKNWFSKTSKKLRELRANRKIVCTGTLRI